MNNLEIREALAGVIRKVDMQSAEEVATAMIEMSRMIGGVIAYQTGGNTFAQKLLIDTCRDAIQDGVKVGVGIINEMRGAAIQ